MAGKKLKPCGTEAAYRRHLQNGETPCDKCKKAHTTKFKRDSRQARVKELGIAPVTVKADEVVPASGSTAEGSSEWQLEKARHSLARIELALQEALPREVPGLVRERRAVVGEIAKLTGNTGEKKGALDEFTARRAARIAAAAS